MSLPTLATLCCVALALGLSLAAHAAPNVRTYPAPAGEPLSLRFTVTADGQTAPVYVAHVLCIDKVGSHGVPEQRLDGEAGFASFDMGRKSVTVAVTCNVPVQTAKLLPTSYGLTPTVSGSTVTFRVNHPGQITLEINGDWNNSLHVFADPFETSVPDPKDPNVIYFGPGVHVIQPLKVTDNQTVYIAGGAILYGQPSTTTHGGPVLTLVGKHITIRGRGIIDSSLIPKPSPGGNIMWAHATDLRVEGVTLRDSSSWNFNMYACNNVKVDDIKIFGCRGNSDGIDINNSQDVDVKNCFFRTFDDDIVIKSSDVKAQETKNVTASRCVFWNEIAHPLSLGAELNVGCENVTFSDCDIIHDKGREWLMRVYNSGAGAIKNVTWDNIRIEESRRSMSLWIGASMWVKGGDRGHIDNITFSNITSVAPETGEPYANLTGFDADHAIHNVTFKNVQIGGHLLGPGDVLQNQFVDGVTFQP